VDTVVQKASIGLTDAERRLCARLTARDEPLTIAIAEAARRHRVHLLLAARLTPEERRSSVGAPLAREATVAAALDAWQADDVRALLGALADARVGTLVLKGTALAHTLYDESHLRPRLDVDLLIRRDALAAAERVLTGLGWTRPSERDAELAEPQRHYVKTGRAGRLDHLDVHWRIANPRVFAEAITFDDLSASAVPVPRLGAGARAPSNPDALLLACVHRVAHHGDAVDLLWLWDIHLLVARLTGGERAAFADRAHRASMCAVCVRGVALANELFATPNCAETIAILQQRWDGAEEPSARFLGGVRPIEVLAADLRTLKWPGRMRLLAEHLFPSIEYMRVRYPNWPRVGLPLAYVDRIVRGAPKWFAGGSR